MPHVRNNVHVSGKLIREGETFGNIIQLIIGITVAEKILPVTVEVQKNYWETFKANFPDRYKSVSVSGILNAERIDGNMTYKVFVTEPTSISCFNNILNGSLNETQTVFYGPVRLKKKFDFDTESKLYLKRMIFETAEKGQNPTSFEAVALRSAAPYFDEINEGEMLLLRANYVLDKKKEDYPPYWRVSRLTKASSCFFI